MILYLMYLFERITVTVARFPKRPITARME